MRRTGLLLIAGCLAVSSGCLCKGICTKRDNELCCPTDVRKTHFWCFGEDAIIHGPCGPKEELYGYEPTCWRAWPAMDMPGCDGGPYMALPNPPPAEEKLPEILPSQNPVPDMPRTDNPFKDGTQNAPASSRKPVERPSTSTAALPFKLLKTSSGDGQRQQANSISIGPQFAPASSTSVDQDNAISAVPRAQALHPNSQPAPISTAQHPASAKPQNTVTWIGSKRSAVMQQEQTVGNTKQHDLLAPEDFPPSEAPDSLHSNDSKRSLIEQPYVPPLIEESIPADEMQRRRAASSL